MLLDAEEYETLNEDRCGDQRQMYGIAMDYEPRADIAPCGFPLKNTPT